MHIRFGIRLLTSSIQSTASIKYGSKNVMMPYAITNLQMKPGILPNASCIMKDSKISKLNAIRLIAGPHITTSISCIVDSRVNW